MQPEFAGDDAITKQATEELRDNELTSNPFVSGDAYEVIADQNGIITLRTRKTLQGVLIVKSPFLCSASIAYTRNGITTIRLTRQWEFLERYQVKQDVTSFNFKETVRNSADDDYRIECFWIARTAGETNPNLYWRLNSEAVGFGDDGSDYTFSAATTAGLLLGSSLGVDGSHYISSDMIASETEVLTFTKQVHEFGGNTADVAADFHGGKLTDAITIKELGVQSSQTGGIDTGSWFDLYRRPQFDKTPLTLWVY